MDSVQLRKTVQPAQEQTRRTDNSVKLWVLEAKNVPAKKKYFCEVCLDKTLYARTSSKCKNDMLFWGEQFDFSNIPSTETITVNLYKEADKKKKKDKNQLLGYVHIPVCDINKGQLVEKWYVVSSAVVGKMGKENKADLPLIRVKARYQTVHILPMELYQNLISYLKVDYVKLVEVLEPVVSVKSKEELAMTMVSILQRLGTAKEFLSDIVMAEVDKLENDNLAFRGNSIATKAMEAYMKLVGEKYLQDTLGDFIRTVLEATDDCEVDPTRVPNNTQLGRQQTNLVMYCEMAWFKIINSYCFFPVELREVFTSFKERCSEQKRCDISNHLISACIFLRFLCPAILSPSLFSLSQEFPQEKAARNLTLIAKTVQNLANFTKYGAKEEYMTFMNEFMDREMNQMSTFLEQISTVDNGQSAALEFDGYIDLGKELSVLHALLEETFEKMDEAQENKLSQLKRILAEITELLENPQGTLRKPPPCPKSMRIYDNLAGVRATAAETRPNTADNNANATNQLLTTLLKDYNDADLSRTHDFTMLNNSGGDYSSSVSTASTVGEYGSGNYGSLGSYGSGSGQRAARDLSTTDDYVLFSALEQRLAAQNHGVYNVHRQNSHQERPNEQQVNQSWNRIVSAAELVNGDYIDLLSYMDGEEGQNSSIDLDNGSQVSIGQLSTVASSGYQSFGYSQSSSPVDSGTAHDMVTPVTQPLSFANPLFQHQNLQAQHPSGVLPPSDLPRILSSSSLSSEDAPGSPCHKVASQSKQNGGSHVTETTNNKKPISANSYSSSSCESLSRLSKDSPKHGSRQSADIKHDTWHSGRGSQLKHSHSVGGGTSSLVASTQLSECQQTNDNPLVALGDLSKSADFTQNKRSSPQRMKRTATDTVLSQSASVSTPSNGELSTYSRRSTMPHNTVRMGVRSMQHRIVEQDKNKTDYEHELTLLRQQLAETQLMLQETQQRLLQRDTTNQEAAVSTQQQWQEKMDAREEELQHQADTKETQLKGVIQRGQCMKPSNGEVGAFWILDV